MRLQLALNVADLDEAVDFYTKMFGVGPAERTGKSGVRYWPGGRRAGSAS